MIKVTIKTVGSECATVTTNQENVTYRITKADNTVLNKHFIKASPNANSVSFLHTAKSGVNNDSQEAILFGKIDTNSKMVSVGLSSINRISDTEFEIESQANADHICILSKDLKIKKASSIPSDNQIAIEVLCDGDLDFPSAKEVEKDRMRGGYSAGGCEDMLEDVGTALEALGRVIKGIRDRGC